MATNSNNDDFEIVEASSVQFARRGRKTKVDAELVGKLKGMKPGQTAMVRKMALDPKSADFKTAKARVGSQLRNACTSAGLKGFAIRWTLDGVPSISL